MTRTLEEKKKLARNNSLILSIVVFPGLAAIIALTFFYSEIRPYLMWFFGVEELWIMVRSFVPMFTMFITICGVIFALYLWKYISTKKKMNEFSAVPAQ